MSDIGKIQPVEIVAEMQKSYLDYAMSVIVARALPDVRDGLKPVQRRIIYAMHQMGLHPTARFTKSAKVVGEVLGKYHPHGDAPVYEAMVRMAQDFSLRYTLVWGQGNFGSIDGDPPAAMRYTECKLATICEELLRDIEKETVDFSENFDATLKEPQVLPTVLPNLLLNGGSGIAVGMATNIPPHNLGEVIDAIVYLIDQPEATLEDLLKFIKGPDFPTGGQIYDFTEISQVYATGRGRVLMRAKAEIEEERGGRYQIIITELPYQVNKALLVAKIADLVREKKLEGVSDLRDESDRRGMRIVVELKRDGRPQAVLNNLYKYTAMQQVFAANFVTLVDGTPQTLTLKMMLSQFLKHRQIVITRRSQFELSEAKKRAHILEGLKIAVENIDEVIETIKKSRDAEAAKVNLRQRFKLTEIQATAILDMQLRRLAALERQKIEDEYQMVLETITYLEDLLAHPEKILKVVKTELLKLKEKYSDGRKTRVFKQKVGEFSEEDLITDEPCVVTLTLGGYIKRQNILSFRTQLRGGKGVTGITTKEEDTVSHFVSCQTHDQILFFTDRGRVFQLRVWELPEGSRPSKGQAIVNLINVEQGEEITSLLTYHKGRNKTSLFSRKLKNNRRYVFMVTKNGTVKKTELSAYENIRRNGLVAIKLEPKDRLYWTRLTSSKDNLILVTKLGQSIRFAETDVRPTGRDTMGVRGIRLKKDDAVAGINIVDSKSELLVVTRNGFGKKTKLSAWQRQKRGGAGIKAAKITEKTGPIVYTHVVEPQEKLLILTSARGQVIKLDLKEVPSLGRATQGVTLMRFSNGQDFVSAATCAGKEKDN